MVFVRNRHVVLFGAQRPYGRRLAEALLALGAHVVAVGVLRTELEALRAELLQHHRLHVAECSADELGPTQLLTATVRRGHVDAVVYVADDTPHSWTEAAALARAVANVTWRGPLQVVFALPCASDLAVTVDCLARPDYPREFTAAVTYDPSDLGPAVSEMLTLLSSPPPTES